MFRIKNWSSFQSYKDRQPPWIRLHKNLLDDFAFQKMSADARAMLPMLWLMASEDKDPVSGLIRFGYETVSFRLRQPEKIVKAAIAEIISAGFITEEKTTSYESVTESLRNRHSETETETETYFSSFNDFWNEYPKKVSKGLAEKAYKKAVKVVGHETLITGVKRYAEECRGKDATYIAHAATWLNGKRWEDEATKSKELPWNMKPQNRMPSPAGG